MKGKKTMAARTRKSRASYSRRFKVATNPVVMNAQFQHLRVRKLLEASKEIHADNDRPPHGLPPSSNPQRIIIDVIGNALRRYKWCRDVEAALDSGIKFLQDHGKDLTEEQKEDFRKDLAGLLNS